MKMTIKFLVLLTLLVQAGFEIAKLDGWTPKPITRQSALWLAFFVNSGIALGVLIYL